MKDIKNFLIKREQSQARLSFAKREKSRLLAKLMITLVALLAVTTGAYAASVSYVDGNGTSQNVEATELESTTTSWTDGSWYIVPEGGLTISGRIAVSGTVNLILRDGTELTASAGITTTGATLNIYAQSTGTGALTATGANGASHTGGNAGIGGIGVGDRASGGAGGTVNIYGGTVTATGGNGGQGGGGGAGIGGGGAGWYSKADSGAGGTVNIYGGTVTATGGTGGNYGGGGSGIGGGGNGYSASSGGQGGTVNIYGSTVTATGGNGGQLAGGGAGIGGGGYGEDSSAGAGGTLTLGVGVKLYNGTDNTGTVLDDNDSESRNYSGSRPKNMFAEVTVAPSASSGPEVAWDKAKKSGSFKMPGGNVTLEPEYYPQAALTAAPTAINDVPATTDGAIVSAGTVANIGETTTAQGTVMYYVSQSALDDAALLALAADQWTADVPTAAGLAQGQAYVYYYVRGNDSDTDEEIFSDGDILAANALTVTIAAEPTYAVTFAEGVNPEPPAEPEWTASPAADVKKGQTVTVTYSGTKKVIGVKAEKKAKATGPITVTLTPGEIGDLFSWDSTSKTINGITIAISGDAQFHGFGLMKVSANDPDTGEPIPGDGTYTFTSSVGNIKQIDINHNVGRWRESGAGWPGSYEAYDISTFTWSGTPAASVTLSGSGNDENDCMLNEISSIVFTIEPTN